MRISIIHPSRSRPEMAFATAKKWLSCAEKPEEIEYIMSTDTDDPSEYSFEFPFSIAKGKSDKWDKYFLVSPNKSAIEAINAAAKICTGDLIVVISDDFDTCAIWDTVLKNALKGKSDFLVKTDDGIQPTLITLPIMDRVYYERFGYVYHPGYKHMFCDTEMTALAEMTGKVISLPILFKHNHYIVGGMKKDAINIRNDASWNQGEKLFNERKAINFGLKDEEIVKPYSAIKWR